MSNYLIKKDATEKKILEVKTSNYYTFSPRGSSYQKVSSVTIYDSDKINYILHKKLFIKYQRLMKILNDIESADSSDNSDYMILLGEVAKMKAILEFKYQKFLKKELYEKFLNDLCSMEEYVNVKLETKEIGIRR